MKPQICASCGHVIRETEQRLYYKTRVVCAPCFARLRYKRIIKAYEAQAAPRALPGGYPQPAYAVAQPSIRPPYLPPAEAHDGYAQPVMARDVELAGWPQYCNPHGMQVIPNRLHMPDQSCSCKDAGTALTCAIVGLFIFGIVLEPMAIYYGLKAQRQIEEDPRLTGSGKATAAVIIGTIGLIFCIIWICLLASGSVTL